MRDFVYCFHPTDTKSPHVRLQRCQPLKTPSKALAPDYDGFDSQRPNRPHHSIRSSPMSYISSWNLIDYPVPPKHMVAKWAHVQDCPDQLQKREVVPSTSSGELLLSGTCSPPRAQLDPLVTLIRKRGSSDTAVFNPSLHSFHRGIEHPVCVSHRTFHQPVHHEEA